MESETLAGVESYYDDDYDILLHSEEEDQVYEVRNGKPVYRTDHQVLTLLAKVPLSQHTNLLDYGCAKGSTIRALSQLNLGIVPHLFDVSERYIPFWRKFVLPDQWSVHATKPEWVSKFDVVTSFFSLEHIPKPADTLRHIAELLKPGGTFYGIVPNVTRNIADFIVVDHCNHFTRPSLTHVLSDVGMELREIDELAHRGAFVVMATKSGKISATLASRDSVCLDETRREMSNIAQFWREASERIRAYECGLADNERVAIYGAGFYGAFVASSLARRDRVTCHLDQNPFLQGKAFNDLPVLAPADLPLDIRTVLVGLNPSHAKEIIADVAALAGRNLRYFYL